jgi:hypothetical protein
MSINTYFRPNIHQNGPEILGVKGRIISKIGKWGGWLVGIGLLEIGSQTSHWQPVGVVAIDFKMDGFWLLLGWTYKCIVLDLRSFAHRSNGTSCDWLRECHYRDWFSRYSLVQTCSDCVSARGIGIECFWYNVWGFEGCNVLCLSSTSVVPGYYQDLLWVMHEWEFYYTCFGLQVWGQWTLNQCRCRSVHNTSYSDQLLPWSCKVFYDLHILPPEPTTYLVQCWCVLIITQVFCESAMFQRGMLVMRIQWAIPGIVAKKR